jgi:hypothetical protein
VGDEAAGGVLGRGQDDALAHLLVEGLVALEVVLHQEGQAVGVVAGDVHDLAAYLRQPGEHVRGCWVVDLLLGKA